MKMSFIDGMISVKERSSTASLIRAITSRTSASRSTCSLSDE